MGSEEPVVQTFPLASSMSDTQFRHVPLGALIVWSTNHAPERRTTAIKCRFRPSVAHATVSAGPLFEICCWTSANVVQVEPSKTVCQIRASVVTTHTCSSVGCATGVKPASAPAHEMSANGPTRPAPGILTALGSSSGPSGAGSVCHSSISPTNQPRFRFKARLRFS